MRLILETTSPSAEKGARLRCRHSRLLFKLRERRVCACAHMQLRGRSRRLLNRAVSELGGQSCTWKAPEAGLGTPKCAPRHARCCCQPLCACSRRGLRLRGRDWQALGGDAADAGAAQRATRVQLPPRRRRKRPRPATERSPLSLGQGVRTGAAASISKLLGRVCSFRPLLSGPDSPLGTGPSPRLGAEGR